MNAWKPYLSRGDRVSDALYHMLTETGSLTRYLQQRHAQAMVVQFQWNDPAQPTLEEASYVDVPFRQRIWRREVRLCFQDRPWVLARSVLPIRPTHPAFRRLVAYGKQPIGRYLFSKAVCQRSQFEYALFDKAALQERLISISTLNVEQQQFWCRRSLFDCQGYQFGLMEVFNIALT